MDSAPREIDGREVVTGTTKYGIDTRVPGMLFASIERPPSLGAKARRWDEKAARSVNGVRAVLPVKSGVAVVGDSTWAALKGRAALAVDWDESAGETIRFNPTSRDAGEIFPSTRDHIAAGKTIEPGEFSRSNA